MAFDPVSAVLGIGETIIKRVWPDPGQQAEALLNLKKLEQSGDLASLNAEVQLLSGQLEINKMEALHGGWFKGGWRPAVGWICAFAMAYKFILQPALIAVVQITAYVMGATEFFPIEMLPEIAWTELSVVLLGMLGIGGMRSYDKGRVR